MLDELRASLENWSAYELAGSQWAPLGWAVALLLAWGLLRHFLGWRFRAPSAGRFTGGGLAQWLAWLPAALRLAGLVLLLLALLRPQIVRRSSQSTQLARDLYLVLDVSGSMQAPDLEPTRLAAAKATLKRFADRVPGDRLGLVVFAGKAFVQCPLTLDHEVVKWFIDQVELGTVAADGTALGDGLLMAVSRLAREPKAGQVAVLATDGRANTGQDPALAAQVAASSGVRVYTIGIGRQGGAVVRQRDFFGRPVDYRMEEPDEPMLKGMAAATGGRYFRATDAGSLDSIYGDIATLERREVEVKKKRDADEHFWPFLLAGALLLLGEAILRLRLRVVA